MNILILLMLIGLLFLPLFILSLFIYNNKFKHYLKLPKNQPTHCGCGFPIRPTVRTFRESPIEFKQVYVKHDMKCNKCGKINTVIG